MKKAFVLFSAYLLIASFILMLVPITGFCYTSYNDVSGEHWAYEAIDYASQRRWLCGYSDGTFRPDNTITRSEAVKVLVSYLNLKINEVSSSSFADVDPNQWYAPYVEAGKNILPVDVETYKFRPEEPLVRGDAIFALVRITELNKSVKYVDQAIINGFSDGHKVKDEFKPYFAMAIQTLLISGYSDSTIRPDAPVTRAEFVTLLYRALLINHGENKEVIDNTASGEEHEIDNTYNKDVCHGEFQEKVFELINKIRVDNGLNELIINNKLADVAQLKAQDMSENNYFAHVSPTYGSPYEMMSAFNVGIRMGYSENIEKGQQTPEEVVDSWMNSETTKAAILCKDFKETGVGYVAEANIWVQLLIG